MAFYLFTYTMTHDTGFAPAVSDGVLSLACCSPQLRRKIAGLLDGKNEIWFMGLMGKTLAPKCKRSCEEFAYAPVYIAKADHTVKASEYFKKGGKYAAPHRRDQVYLFDGEHWSVTEKIRMSNMARHKKKKACKSRLFIPHSGGPCGRIEKILFELVV